MQKTKRSLVTFLLVVPFLFFQGCAQDKQFVKKDALLHSPLKCVRYETPGILRSTMAETFFLSTAAIALPGGSALLLVSDEYAKTRGEAMQSRLPDFGRLVLAKFSERMSVEAGDWPVPAVENNPVKEEYSDSCTLIEFKVKRLAYGYLDFMRGAGNGFLSKTVAIMKEPNGDLLWQKSFTYSSRDYERGKTLDEFEADGGKLLKDEMEFAAEKTVAAFYGDLKGEQQTDRPKTDLSASGGAAIERLGMP